MAQYIRLDGLMEYDDLSESHNAIQIICDGDTGIDFFQDEEIKRASNITVVEVPTLVGGGGGGIPSLWFGIFTLISLSFVLVGKAFISEVGKELAQRLFKKLSNQQQPSQVTIIVNNYEIYCIVPARMSDVQAKALAGKLNAFVTNLSDIQDHNKIYITYDKDTEKMVVISR